MSARAWLSFGAVSVLWGIPYLFVRVVVDDGISPAFLAWSRALLGAAVLVPLAWRAGLLGSLRGRWKWVAAYAAAEIAVPFPLIAAGEQHISSSVAAILIAASPLLVALLALGFDAGERVHGARLGGLLIGLAGVAALVGIDIGGTTEELRAAGLILIAALGYAIAPMLLRRKLADLDMRAVIAAALVLASIPLTPFAFAALPTELPPPDALASLVVLGVACTATALVLFGSLVTEVGAGRALVVTYLAPLVAVVAGMLVLGERPGPGAAAGLALILAGSWLGTGGDAPEAAAGTTPRA